MTYKDYNEHRSWGNLKPNSVKPKNANNLKRETNKIAATRGTLTQTTRELNFWKKITRKFSWPLVIHVSLLEMWYVLFSEKRTVDIWHWFFSSYFGKLNFCFYDRPTIFTRERKKINRQIYHIKKQPEQEQPQQH